MAGKQERQRKLARERYERKLTRQAEQQARTRRLTAIIAVIVVIAGAAVAGVLTYRSLHGSPAAAATPSPTPTAATPSPSASPSVSPSAVTEPARHCTYAPGTASKLAGARNVGIPSVTPDFRAAYQATFRTNRGPIVINLLNSKATCTVNSFVFLAMKKYFNNTHCHRLTTSGIYVLQCGDPTGTGQGGPGYQFADENLTGATYSAATLAMANAGANTNGSQFFLVYKDSSLPPNYTPFGTIVSGLNILQNVAKAGTDNATGAGDGHPKEKVVIESVTIKKT